MVARQYAALTKLVLPVRWGELSVVLLASLFPVVTVFYAAFFGTLSVPWLTRLLFAAMLTLWFGQQRFKAIWITKASPLDWIVAIFFCFALIGYVRSDSPNLTFQYFLALNLVAFLVGRYTNVDARASLLAYFFGLGLLVTVACILALPEIYHQWEIAGPRHPVLYGIAGTAGGLDVIMGFLPVLSGVLIIAGAGQRSKMLHRLLHASVLVSVVLLVLIGSKSVVVAAILTLIGVMATQYKLWRGSRSLLAVLVCALGAAAAIAPKNNRAYYGLNSPNDWVDAVSEAKMQGIGAGQISAVSIPGVVDEADTGVARIKIAANAIREIFDNPALGVGPREWDYFSPHPHNVLLESALAFGIPSFIALSIFFIVLIWRLTTAQSRTTRAAHIEFVAIGALLSFQLVYNLAQGQLASFRSLPLFLLGGYASAVVAQWHEAWRIDLVAKRKACP